MLHPWSPKRTLISLYTLCVSSLSEPCCLTALDVPGSAAAFRALLLGTHVLSASFDNFPFPLLPLLFDWRGALSLRMKRSFVGATGPLLLEVCSQLEQTESSTVAAGPAGQDVREFWILAAGLRGLGRAVGCHGRD